jgi:hypothetical protein
MWQVIMRIIPVRNSQLKNDLKEESSFMIPPQYLLVCLCLPFDILSQQIYFHNSLNFAQFDTAKTP